ncbi:MAG TPA: calcium-binding protein [Actinomycetota bacterium]
MGGTSRVSRSALKRLAWAGMVLSLTAAFGLPTAAFAAASTVTLVGDPGTVTVTADDLANGINLNDSAGYVTVVDTIQGVTPGAGCEVDPNVVGGVRCLKPAGGVSIIDVILGAGNDGLLSAGLDEPLHVLGGDGNDTIDGGSQADVLEGDAGDDTLDGKGLDDVLTGGADIDTADYDGAPDRIVSLDGVANDGAVGENDNVDTENVTTANGNDTVLGDANANRIVSGAGNDTLTGGPGGDILNGGADVDTVDYSSAGGSVVVTIGGGANDGEAGELDNVSISVENITGGPGDDTLTGSGVANRLLGGVDPDPTLNDGDTGNDTLIGGLGDDALSGLDGNDELFGEDGADTLNGGVGADILDGGLGSGDSVGYPGRTSGVSVNQNKPGGDGQGGSAEGDDVRASVERVTGTAFADTLVGGKVNASILIGGGGNDVLNGGNGHDDIVNGGAGNDRINDNGGRDSVLGSAGKDTFHTSDGARDLINCGKGSDTSSDRDPIDVRKASCE